MSKRADRPPLTAASSDPSLAVGYGIPVAMPTYHYRSGHGATRLYTEGASIPNDGELAFWCYSVQKHRTCNGLSTKDRIMFFAAAIGGRLYGKEQTQADA